MKVHAILTSYEVAVTEAAELRKLQFESLVVDEGHRLKNSSSRWVPGHPPQLPRSFRTSGSGCSPVTGAGLEGPAAAATGTP